MNLTFEFVQLVFCLYGYQIYIEEFAQAVSTLALFKVKFIIPRSKKKWIENLIEGDILCC